MSDVIRLLPDSIANKIAAGEVVQRPSSVVKELLENALDAGSKQITLIVKDAGKSWIQVVDDGSGMSETDARMSFERHATSKIRAAEDLFSLKTMGFRGEALASIAAVAQVEMKTRRHQDELGSYLRIEGSEVKESGPTATPVGTSITVKNLFFNIPARRNFLKSNPVELKHILEEFQRVSLSRPDIGFKLYQNDLETYNLSPGNLSQRIVGLFGDSFRAEMAHCSEQNDFVNIQGILGRPENAKKTRGEQYLFANGRYIRHPYLHHAIVQAYQHVIGDDMHPFYVLFLETDPNRIDVNVHPTKTEVKFDDDRGMYAIVHAAVRKALNDNQLIPAIDFEMDVNFADRFAGRMPEEQRIMSRAGNADTSNAQANSTWPITQPPREIGGWEKLYGSKLENLYPNKSDAESQPNSERETNSTALPLPFIQEEAKNTFQIHNAYIVSQIRSGMIIVDQHLAHFRILFEKFLAMLDKKHAASQQFLFPLTVDLSPADFALVMDIEPELKQMGFTFNHFGKNTLVINGIPSDLNLHAGGEKDLFEGLIEQFKNNQQQLKINKREQLARAVAKRAALRHGVRLSVQEMNSLIDQLFACQHPNFAPGGAPIVHTITLDYLSQIFDKNA